MVVPASRSTSALHSVAAVASALRTAGCVFAEDEARLLMDEAPGPGALAGWVDRRVNGVPLEHILGWAGFDGGRISVDAGVFVPRRRTELLVHEAVKLLHHASSAARGVVVDLCCGSGAVGAAIARRRPDIELHAADIDPAAVECARRNVNAFGAHVHQGDLFEALPLRLRGRVQVLAVNAPYVPTGAIGAMPPEARLFEPHAALDGGADGLDFHRRISAGAPEWIAPAGHLLIETSRHQSESTAALLIAAGLAARVVHSGELDGTVVVGTPHP